MANYQADLRNIENKISDSEKKLIFLGNEEKLLKPRSDRANTILRDAQIELTRLENSVHKVQVEVEQAQNVVDRLNEERSRLANEKARIASDVEARNKEKVRIQKTMDGDARKNSFKK